MRDLLPLTAVTVGLLLFCASWAQAAALPDNRGYEQVSPANKDSGEPTTALFGTAPTPFAVSPAATDGNRLAYISFNAFPGSQSFGTYYLATRGASNWSSVNLIPPQSTEGSLLCGALASDTPAYSHDLNTNVLSDGFGQDFGCGRDDPPLVPNAFDPHYESRYSSNLFMHDNLTGAYYLVNITPPDADINCTLMALASNQCIAAFNAGSADLSHVVFDETTPPAGPGLTADAPSGVDNLYEWVKGSDSVRLVTYLPDDTPVQGSIAGGQAGYAFHAVSDDGSKIFFVSGGNLYVRIDGTSTQQVDAPAAGAAGPGGGGQFVAASSDGSKAFFTDADTAGLTTDTQPGSGTNLYVYDVAADTLTDLTPGADVAVQGFVGSSDDGSYIYFVANGALAGGATSGSPNLYVIHNGGSPRFITTLDAGTDSCNWTSPCARVSSNGLYLGLTSAQDLTGFPSGGMRQVFLYSFASDQLSCASCNQGGPAPTSDTVINTPEPPLEFFAGINEYLQRQVSDNGQVFFQTTEALVPSDSNGQQDIYEYQSGAVSLLSTGTSAEQSMFWDASPSGDDVFFATYERLVPQDTDGSGDLYDARVGGGFPVSAPPAICEGEGCKPPVSGQPAPPIAASVTFSGPGNATTPATGGRIRMLRKRAIRGTRVSVLVGVPMEGDLTARGRYLGTTSFSVPRAGRYLVTLKLTKRGHHALKRKRRLKLAIRVRFDPAVGKASTVTVRLTMKPAARKAER